MIMEPLTVTTPEEQRPFGIAQSLDYGGVSAPLQYLRLPFDEVSGFLHG